MDWVALPVAGGIYDQHPKLIEEWTILLALEAEQERKRQAEQERKAKQQKSRRR